MKMAVRGMADARDLYVSELQHVNTMHDYVIFQRGKRQRTGRRDSINRCSLFRQLKFYVLDMNCTLSTRANIPFYTYTPGISVVAESEHAKSQGKEGGRAFGNRCVVEVINNERPDDVMVFWIYSGVKSNIRMMDDG